jgi:hypothetical protein
MHANSIAHYYDIPELKLRANAKIGQILESTWSADGFSKSQRQIKITSVLRSLPYERIDRTGIFCQA